MAKVTRPVARTRNGAVMAKHRTAEDALLMALTPDRMTSGEETRLTIAVTTCFECYGSYETWGSGYAITDHDHGLCLRDGSLLEALLTLGEARARIARGNGDTHEEERIDRAMARVFGEGLLERIAETTWLRVRCENGDTATMVRTPRKVREDTP